MVRCAVLGSLIVLGMVGPATADTIYVPPGGDLREAMDRAQPGDVILLEPGAVYRGDFVLSVKDGSEYITIRSATPDDQLPGPTERMTWDYAGLLPIIENDDAYAVFRTVPGAHHWRLQFLHIRAARLLYNLIQLGGYETTVGATPSNIILDRLLLEAHSQGTQRGVAVNGRYLEVLNSSFYGFWDLDTDSQAIMGWNGPGPILIENNYLEAGSENVLFGGADPLIPYLVPSDIVIRRNDIVKPIEWREHRHRFLVKNLLQLKNAQRVLIEGNRFTNCWVAAQDGTALSLSVTNQHGGCTWCIVRDVTIRHNIIESAEGNGLIISGRDWYNPSDIMTNVRIENNLWLDIGGWFIAVSRPPSDLAIDHNTVVNLRYTGAVWLGDRERDASGFTFTNNLVPHRSYGIFGGSYLGTTTMTEFYGSSVVFRKNALVGLLESGYDASYYPPENEVIDHGTTAEYETAFVDPVMGDYRLVPGTVFWMIRATDGGEIGVNMDALEAARGIPFAGARLRAQGLRLLAHDTHLVFPKP